jgi:hypothetical protein
MNQERPEKSGCTEKGGYRFETSQMGPTRKLWYHTRLTYWTQIWISNHFHFQSGFSFDSFLIFIQALIPHPLGHFKQLLPWIADKQQYEPDHQTNRSPDYREDKPNLPAQAEDAQEEKPIFFFCFRSSC